MRAVMREVPQEWLDERRRHGKDRLDEVWDGVLHVAPAPETEHQILASDLEFTLRPLAKRLELLVLREVNVCLGADFKDFRVPDLSLALRADVSRRGVEGHAALVIEVLSANDESRDKFAFFARCEIAEVWLIDPATRTPEIYVLREGVYFAIAPDRAGSVRSPLLDLTLCAIEGPKLAIRWADGHAEI